MDHGYTQQEFSLLHPDKLRGCGNFYINISKGREGGRGRTDLLQNIRNARNKIMWKPKTVGNTDCGAKILTNQNKKKSPKK